MTVDISKIKPGDKVTLVPLEVTCVEILCGIRSIHFADGSWTFVKNLAAHHPAPREFQVGDRVSGYSLTMDVVRTGEIIGLDDDFAWVRWECPKNRSMHHISQLTLVEEML